MADLLERFTSVRMFVTENLKLCTLDEATKIFKHVFNGMCLSGAHCFTETIMHKKSVCVCKQGSGAGPQVGTS